MDSFIKESNMMDALDNLYDIAMEAIAQRREAEEDKVKKIVLPRLALQVMFSSMNTIRLKLYIGVRLRSNSSPIHVLFLSPHHFLPPSPF